MALPVLKAPKQYRQYQQNFKGYNASLRISDEEFSYTRNLSNRDHPVLSTRKRRGEVRQLTAPGGCISKDVIYYVDGTTLYANGVATPLTALERISVLRQSLAPQNPVVGQYWYDTSNDICHVWRGAWAECAYPQKQLVSMGAYICIFPDKVYINTQNWSDNGNMDASTSVSLSGSSVASFAPVTSDGSAVDAVIGTVPPENPTSGQYWVNTSTTPHSLMVYSAAQGEWSSVATTYIHITATGIGNGFSDGDAAELSGFAGNPQLEAINGIQILRDVSANGFTVVGMLDQTATQNSGTISSTRSMPDMDFVCECQNRLWGCKYGLVDGNPVNEIYCSKLGDFKNWKVYSGISTDSWAASVGSDGQWTGCINYLSHPTFFKEDRIHRVTVSATGAHSVTEIPCRGVQLGSERSLAMAGELLYYKSRTGVCVYDGSLPVEIGEALGDKRYSMASAATVGDYYYISMHGADGWSLFVYDGVKQMWMREDATDIIGAAQIDDDIWYVDARDLLLRTVFGTSGEEDDILEWEAVSGVIGYEYPDKKYLSRFDFRIKCIHMECYIEYDSSGEWIPHGCVHRGTLGTFVLPVRPRRCDHLRIKLVGSGDMSLYSVAKILEVGSDA